MAEGIYLNTLINKNNNSSWNSSSSNNKSNIVEEQPKTDKKVHGNSLDYPGTNYGYILKNKYTGEILKYGESIHPENRYTNKQLLEYNANMEVLKEGSKIEIHQWQHDMNVEFFNANGYWQHYQKTLKDGNNMILKLFEPAYYTKEYGIDNDIKRMLHDISDYFALKQYSELINKITISTAIAPKEIFSKGLWEETIKCWPKTKDAFVCRRIDFELYDNATIDHKKTLLIISVLESIKKLEKKGKIDYELFKKDMLEFCKINNIKIENND